MQKLKRIVSHVHLSFWGIIVEVLYVISLVLVMYCITILTRLVLR